MSDELPIFIGNTYENKQLFMMGAATLPTGRP
jgi:hypothetical protein